MSVPLPNLGSDRLDVAVADSTHALVVERGQGGIADAALADGEGKLSELPTDLPSLHQARVLGLEGAFAVVGFRCVNRAGVNERAGDELLCAPDDAGSEGKLFEVGGRYCRNV